MPGQVKTTPTFALTPSSENSIAENFITTLTIKSVSLLMKKLSVMEIEQSLHSYVW